MCDLLKICSVTGQGPPFAGFCAKTLPRKWFFQFILLGLLTCACEGMDTTHVTQDFYLVDMDYDAEERSLSFSVNDRDYVGVVGPTVVGYALSGEYILVKQRPKFFLEPKSTRKPLYYIVDTDVERLRMPEQGVMGPMVLSDFNETCKKMRIRTPVRFLED